MTFQGDKLRLLKSNNADKSTVDTEVKLLLDLKQQLCLVASQGLANSPGGDQGKQKNVDKEEVKRLTSAVADQVRFSSDCFKISKQITGLIMN